MPVYKAVIENIKVETPDVKTYTLKFQDNQEFNFKPGQFVMIAIMCEKDGKEIFLKRAYSIASSPTVKGKIDLTIKKAGIVTSKLDTFKGGEEVEVSGPFGHFIFNDNDSKSIMGIAVGAGISPIWGIFRYIEEKKLPVKMTLLFSNKTPNDLIYKKEIAQIQSRSDNPHIILTATRPAESDPKDLAVWKGKTGRISKDMIKEAMEKNKPDLFFLCGVPDMVNDCVIHLKELGVDPSRIKAEKF